MIIPRKENNEIDFIALASWQWTHEDTASKTMDVELALRFAEALEQVYEQGKDDKKKEFINILLTEKLRR